MRYSATSTAPGGRRVPAGERDVLHEDWSLLGSTYALMVSAALLLAVAEGSLLYAIVCITFCAGHALAVGPGGKPLLSAMAGQFLAVGALVAGLMQASSADAHISYGLAHFLMAVQIIKLYGPRRTRDLRLIQITVVFQAMVAGIWALDLLYLPVFLMLLMSLMANMAAVSLAVPVAPVASRLRPALTGGVRRVGWAAGLWMPTGAVVACTVLLFIALPRVRTLAGNFQVLPQQVTGYSDNVSLQEIGQLRESDAIVMRVSFKAEDEPGEPYVRPPHVLMRGGSRPLYENGLWLGYWTAKQKAESNGQLLPRGPRRGLDTRASDARRAIYRLEGLHVDTRRIRQIVTPESRPMEPLFGLYRWIEVSGMEPYESVTSYGPEHALPTADPRQPGDTYEVVSIVPLFTPPQLRAAGTPRAGMAVAHWVLPGNIQAVIETVAAEIQKGYAPRTDYDRVIAVQSYLLDEDRFTYTYDLPEFGRKDPIEAFLTETYRGSCEQFSTALALIVRAWGIPSRLAVGFKGGDFDPQTQTHIFRDKHAHAWTEVYFNGLGWVQFDPTPGANAAENVHEGALGRLGGWLEGGFSRMLRLYSRASARWGGNVIGYNKAQQQRLFEGLGEAARSLATQAGGIVGGLRSATPGMGLVQIALLVAGVTLAGMGLHMAARWLQGRVGSVRRRAASEGPVRFYRDMLRILRRKGITRAPHVPPREFAMAATRRLQGPREDADAAARAIGLLTDLYCRVRYGRHNLTPQERDSLRTALRQVARAEAGPPDTHDA